MLCLATSCSYASSVFVLFLFTGAMFPPTPTLLSCCWLLLLIVMLPIEIVGDGGTGTW